MTTVEQTRVVNHMTLRTTRGGTKHVDPSDPIVDGNVDVAIKREEEEFVDEEIDSHEADGVHDGDDDVDDQMLTAALVNSVTEVKQQAPGTIEESDTAASRKRRRPNKPSDVASSGDGIKKTKDSGAAQVIVKTPPLSPPGKLPPAVAAATAAAAGTLGKAIKAEGGPQLAAKVNPPPIRPQPPLKSAMKPKIAPLASVKGKQPLPTAIKAPQKAAAAKPRQRKPKAAPTGRGRKAPSPRQAPAVLKAATGAVPNPLSGIPPSPAMGPAAAPPIRSMNLSKGNKAGNANTLAPGVPCPLPPSTTEKKVSISEPPAQTRSRVFSVDLDPSTFDFADMGVDEEAKESEPASGSGDLLFNPRDRAFSFEFFNFQGDTDDLLPSAPTASNEPSALPNPGTGLPEVAAARRPRGDSIIFDPTSFQDGGIHEKNALIKSEKGSAPQNPRYSAARAASTAPPSAHMSRPTGAVPPPFSSLTAAASRINSQSSNNNNGEGLTLPSALSNVPIGSGASPATFSMDLLNKDGRIGIYLPDARRARIARFHAKRKMRIWRKRIKYDCRKKLADSRPRIKGRFVKRSDMDEDNNILPNL